MNNNPTNSHVTEVKSNCKTFEARFDGFADLPTTKSNFNFVDSPEFTCFGHRWFLRVYPGGDSRSTSGRVTAILVHKSDESSEVQATFIVKTTNYNAAAYRDLKKHNYHGAAGVGFPNFASRSKLIGALREGSLIIEVQMRQTEEPNSPPKSFVPENPLCKTILNKFMDEESSDVVFEVEGEQARGDARDKRAKTSTTFYAHRFILQECTSALGELCKSSGDSAPIPIEDVKPDIFRHLLYYLYGGKVSDEDLKANAKDVIDAADKYGVVGLKLEAEVSFVTSTTITLDNVMDNLLYADSKNCALLKEAVMDFIVENGSEAVNKVNFENFPGHLVTDLLTAMNMGKKEVKARNDASDLSTMRVSALRKLLHEKGLDIDGSREAMIALLQENSSN